MKIIKSNFYSSDPQMAVLKPNKDKLSIATQEGHYVILKEQITCLIADSNYTTICFKDVKVLCARTIGTVLEQLNHPAFIRIHKSHAINIEYLRMIDSAFSFVKLDNEIQLPIARSQKQIFKNIIQRRFD